MVLHHVAWCMGRIILNSTQTIFKSWYCTIYTKKKAPWIPSGAMMVIEERIVEEFFILFATTTKLIRWSDSLKWLRADPSSILEGGITKINVLNWLENAGAMYRKVNYVWTCPTICMATTNWCCSISSPLHQLNLEINSRKFKKLEDACEKYVPTPALLTRKSTRRGSYNMEFTKQKKKKTKSL